MFARDGRGARVRSFTLAVALACAVSPLPVVGANVRVLVAGPTMDVVTASAEAASLLAAPWGPGGAADVLRPCPSPLRLASRAAGPAPQPASEWSVIARTAATRKQADLVLQGLRRAVTAPLAIDESDGRFRILAGPLASEEEAESLAQRLRSAGMAGAKSHERRLPAPPPAPRLVALTPELDAVPVSGDRLLLRVDGGEAARLLVAGLELRGDVIVSVAEDARLLVVNEIDVEDYVRGVVPKEMGPEIYPEPAALEAQALAARTYALRQAGRHAADGADVCATAHCQVYGGAAAEHALSDAAVRATAGLVVAHEGRLANTLYSSTCGGRTEPIENVFGGPPVPYLRSVACYPDLVSFHPLTGRAANADWTLQSGRPAHDLLARLAAVGVLTPAEVGAGAFARRVRGSEAREWLDRAARFAGRALPKDAKPIETDDAVTFVATFVAAVGWDAEAALVAPQDLAAASRFVEFAGLAGDDLVAALVALKNGLLPEGLSPGWGSGKLTRGQALEIVDLWLRAVGAFDVAPVRFLSGGDRAINVARGKERLRLELAPDAFLAAGREGLAPRPVPRLDLKLGDKIRVLGPRPGVAAYVALEEDPDGAASDRLSAWSWWTRRIPLDQVAREAASRLGLEGLTDVRVTKRSPAGRVIGLQLTGVKGEKREATGFATRQVLGLPEMRAHVEFERDAAGRLRAVVATGRGWGHGVGLCQTGAFGMALAGATARDIIERYYPGTETVPASSLPAAP